MGAVRFLLLILIGWCGAVAAVQAQVPERDSAVKAAYLMKFSNFVEWPAGAFTGSSDALVIAVYGDEEIAAELERLALHRQGRPVQVRRLREGEAPGRPHILYAGGPRAVRVREVLAAAVGPVLTVTDSPAALSASPVITFVPIDGRMRFNASLTAAAAHDLRLSARLLAVANQVEGRS